MGLETKYEKLTISVSVLLLILVCGTGFWVYDRLATVAEGIVLNRPKDSRLILLKELSTEMMSAENEAFTYSFRKDQNQLVKFYELTNRSEFKLNQLKGIASTDYMYPVHIDSLRSIVNQRYETLEEMILVRNENRVNDAMEQVMNEVKSIVKRKKQPAIKVPAAVPEKRKWYQRRKQEEIKAVTQPSTASSTASTINQELVEIKNDVVTREKLTNTEKLMLERKNNRLTERYNRLVQTIENREKRAILAEAETAKVAAEETNIVIAAFCVTSVLLIVTATYLILVLFRKTKLTNYQLQIAKDRSDQLAQSKSRFLANMSHEIRTPLNAIVGFTEQLQQTHLEQEQQSTLAIIGKAADHLTHITNEILDFSKINAGAVQLEAIRFSLREEVEFVEQSLKDRAVANNNQFTVLLDPELPDYVLGDPLRLRQILINLMGNAMKFTSSGTVKLLVKPSLQSQEETTIIFTLSDTGIGISKENLSRIFDEFEQAEITTTRNYGGTGLGLSITRELIELMGGQLKVQSEVNKGTTFTISLPFRIAEAAEVADKKPEAADLSFLVKKRILVVDDEAYNRKLLRNMLQRWEVLITEAGNGLEAIEAMKHTSYDLILLDLRMPQLNGFQTRDAILKMGGEHAKTPIVALTAALSNEEKTDMLRKGWNAVLLKPLKLKELADNLAILFPQEESAGPVQQAIEKEAVSAESAAAETAIPVEQAEEEHAEVPLSLEPLKEISGNDSAFYLDMLKTLHRTTHDGLQVINQASQQKDWEGMAEAAHKIASPVKHIQAYGVYELLKNLENAGRKHDIDPAIGQQISHLNQLVETILQLLNKEIKSLEWKV